MYKIHTEIYFKELTPVVVGPGKSEIHRASRLETQAGVDDAASRRNLVPRKPQFWLLWPSTD